MRLEMKYGFRRDQRDPRDHLWTPSPDDIGVVEQAGWKIDLREGFPPVMTQGAIGSCTAHGVTCCLRYIIIKHGSRAADRDLSRLQLYYDSRVIENSINDDAGAEIRDVIKCARTIGVARENLWPYNPGKYKLRPPENVYEDAHKFTAITYQRLTIQPTDLKVALLTKYPVVFGITLFESFESREVQRSGIVPMPNLEYEKPVGGHCMVLAGYGQIDGHFTVRNSWGPEWGDKGDCYLPAEYVGSALYGADYWRVTRTT
jgi:C1A family cysteine protease